MMPEISLNVLDVAQNSVKAGAKLIEITAEIDTAADSLVIQINDDGCGMTAEQVERVIDPFYTTRTTRKVGLGVSFFKMAAEMSGGEFSISSVPGTGTKVRASFGVSNVDRMPLGDMSETVRSLIVYNTHIDYLYRYRVDDREFTLSTVEMKDVLGGVPLDTPDVSAYIRDFLTENTAEVNAGVIY
ncbi:histidine kinase [Clostridia bacterium]|nr:histidine kinase [Clostridia bacterium]